MRLIVLGSGTSFGVPQIGCRCPTCTSADPRDRRTRTGALIETHGKRLLIDTPPELRLQLVAAGVDRVDAVLFTHAHADHVHGIDDLRALSVRQGAMLPAYGSRDTMAELAAKFPYIFDPSIVVPAGTSKPELAPHVMEPGASASVAGVPVLALSLPHGDTRVFGYRVGAVAYLTDVKAIPDAAVPALAGLEVLVLNALLTRPHPLHLSIPEAVAAAQRIGARRTFFTHLTHEFTHSALAAMLPAGIAPAYDGLVIDVAGA
ncbi:MAG TPA: MBL fold metallo-hydrolase [Gemmatimonadales bacterium]|nr:MBL fold metallo-hydrolase [Gemmatimonadales bacterium]